jgi:hypothetical protein
MARLTKIVRSNPLSNTSTVAPEAGGGFALFAEALETLYSRVAPVAKDQLVASGDAEGREAGEKALDGVRAGDRLQFSQPGGRSPMITSSGGGDMDRWKSAIQSIESDGSGGYSAIGPATKSGDRAYGKYQVMDFNVGPWTEKHFGKRLSPQEFLANEAAQERVFEGEFGSYVKKYGDPETAARVWFGGPGALKNPKASDGYINIDQYASKFRAAGGSAGKAAVEAAAGVTGKGKWLVQNQGGTRAKPISQDLQGAMSFLGDMGITMTVSSGGQMSLDEAKAKGAVKRGKVWYLKGKPVRTGSTRHDHGDAADVTFHKDGRQLQPKNAEDRAILTQIVQKAKANGVTGFGEGDDYMGPGVMHVGFGAPSVWGANGDSKNAPAWLREAFYGAPAGKTAVLSSQASTSPVQPSPEVMIRTPEGKIEPRMYSPFSGPLLQAHNIAAQSAYHDTVLNSGMNRLAEMRMEFEFDSGGYADAAKTYVNALVSQAPDMMRGALRGEFEREVQRTALGLRDAQNRDIRTRASNANKALIDRYSDEYEDALLAGDAEGIAAAKARLGGVLRVREALPGSGWTSENSTNTLLNSERMASKKAEQEADRSLREYTAEVKAELTTIIDALKNGLAAENEALLDDPTAMAVAGEQIREARSLRDLRDNNPDFMTMTPDQMDERVAWMRKTAISEGWQVDRIQDVEKIAKNNRKAWNDDPVQRATEVMDTPPPDITQAIESGDPKAIHSALISRKMHMDLLSLQGYTETPVYFSKDEREMMKAAFSKEVPFEARMVMLEGIMSAFAYGDPTVAFNQIDGDPTTMFAGKLMASGGPRATSAEILRGQSIMAEGLTSMPQKSTFNKAFNSNFAEAFAGVPFPVEARSEVLAAARAIYASRAAGADLDEGAQANLMKSSINAAMGAEASIDGKTVTGGVQEVMGRPTIMPPGVKGGDVDAALEKAFAPIMPDGALATTIAALSPWGTDMVDLDLSAFSEASGMGLPRVLGSEVSADLVMGADIGIVAIGSKGYGLTFTFGNQTYDAEGPNRERYVFRLEDFIDASAGGGE